MYKIRKAISIILVLIVFSTNVIQCIKAYSLSYDEIGDMDESGMINAIDLIIMKKYLLGIDAEEINVERGDITLDNVINVLDFIRLKKYIAGAMQETHSNPYEEAAVWFVPESDAGFGIIATVAYRIYTHSMVYTDKSSVRYTYNVLAFAGTDKRIDVVFSSPTITVGQATINNVSIPLSNYDNILTERDIWDCKRNTSTLFVNEKSTCSFITSCMLNGAIYPLKTITNSFEF